MAALLLYTAFVVVLLICTIESNRAQWGKKINFVCVVFMLSIASYLLAFSVLSLHPLFQSVLMDSRQKLFAFTAAARKLAPSVGTNCVATSDKVQCL